MSTLFFPALSKGPAAYVPKTPWGPWSAVGATLGIFLLAASLSLALCEGAIAFMGGRSLFNENGMSQLGEEAKKYSMIWTIVMQMMLVALCFGAGRLFGGNPLDVLALRKPRQGWGVLLPAFAVLFFATGIYSGISYLLWPQWVIGDLKPFYEMMHSGAGIWLALAGVIGAPFSEEFLFRGFLLGALAQSPVGFLGGVLITNVAWTMLHAQYSIVGLGEVFLVGLIQSWLLWRTGSLWVPIICHGFYNGLILLALFLFPFV